MLYIVVVGEDVVSVIANASGRTMAKSLRSRWCQLQQQCDAQSCLPTGGIWSQHGDKPLGMSVRKCLDLVNFEDTVLSHGLRSQV